MLAGGVDARLVLLELLRRVRARVRVRVGVRVRVRVGVRLRVRVRVGVRVRALPTSVQLASSGMTAARRVCSITAKSSEIALACAKWSPLSRRKAEAVIFSTLPCAMACWQAG